MFSSECRAKDILLELEFGRGISSRGGEEVVIEADPVRLGQIWTNLVGFYSSFCFLKRADERTDFERD